MENYIKYLLLNDSIKLIITYQYSQMSKDKTKPNKEFTQHKRKNQQGLKIKSTFQLQALDIYFDYYKKLEVYQWKKSEIQDLSEQLGLTPTQIYKYLWNKRKKVKKIANISNLGEIKHIIEVNQSTFSNQITGYTQIGKKGVKLYAPSCLVYANTFLVPQSIPSTVIQVLQDQGQSLFAIFGNQSQI